jgi:hypothetical protein
MIAAPLQLDFVEAPRRGSAAGIALLAIGAAVAAWTINDYSTLSGQSASLDMQIGDSAPSPGALVGTAGIDRGGMREAGDVIASLALPWAQLLDNLETVAAASQRDVALLSLEPDREKRRVRIGAEARSLPAALKFAQELQGAAALEYPLLDKHEVRLEQRERPVYFEVTANWSLPQ